MGLDPNSYRLYGKRHTMATVALVEKIHPKVVAERLAHSSISTTLDTYSHAFPAMQDEITDKLGSIVHGQPPKGQESPDVDLEDYELPF